MKAFLEKIERDYLDDFVYMSKHVLLNRGIEVVDFDGTNPNSLRDKNPSINDICIGSVEACNKFWSLIGITPPNYIGYPSELTNYYKRKIDTIRGLNELSKQTLPVFVKPKNDVKLFTGMFIENKTQLDFVLKYYPEIKDDTELYRSAPIEIISEYRCFVYEKQLKGIQWYAGDFKIMLTPTHIKQIEKCIQDYKSSPIAYTLDFAVIKNKKRIITNSEEKTKLALIEINDMWAIGSYGFNSKDYVQMTIARFNQIKNESIKNSN